jgi:hypothetical protein
MEGGRLIVAAAFPPALVSSLLNNFFYLFCDTCAVHYRLECGAHISHVGLGPSGPLAAGVRKLPLPAARHVADGRQVGTAT